MVSSLAAYRPGIPEGARWRHLSRPLRLHLSSAP